MRFYRDRLGFEETFRTPEDGPPGHVELRPGTLVRGLSEPHDFLGRNRAAWVADPDGNPVEIVARAGQHVSGHTT